MKKDKFIKLATILNIVFIIIGAFIFFEKGLELSLIKILLGTIMIIDGLLLINNHIYKKYLKTDLYHGILNIILAILLVLNITKFHNMYIIIFSIYYLLKSIRIFLIYLNNKKKDYKIILLINSILLLILSILLFIYPFDGIFQFNNIITIYIIIKSLIDISIIKLTTNP